MNAIGLIELNSIAAGVQITDTLIKTADIELVVARSICSGKYMAIITGSVAAVESSIEAGLSQNEGSVIDSIVIPNIHESILPTLSGFNDITKTGSLGIIESFSVASLLEAADTAVKAANVTIVEIRLAMALGGKAFAMLTGDVASVTSAVDAGAAVVEEKGLLVNKIIIPAPSKELYQNYI